MARRNPERTGIRGATTAPGPVGPRFQCLGCPAAVSSSRLCCKTCWGRLTSAPGGLKERLAVPDGCSAHSWDDAGYQAAIGEAAAYLAKVRGAR